MDHPVVAPADPSRLYWFTEAQWRQIEAVFPRPNGNKGFAQAVPNRQACEAVLFERPLRQPTAHLADQPAGALDQGFVPPAPAHVGAVALRRAQGREER